MEKWEMEMKKGLGRGNRTCKGTEQKKSYSERKITSGTEWFYCEVQGHGR